MENTSAGPVLVTCLLIGGVIALWFFVASNHANGHTLDLSHGSFMPIYCAIAPDIASDTKVTGHVYLWQDNVRIDVQSVNTATQNRRTSIVHEIVTPNKTAYVWVEGADAGEKEVNIQDFPILETTASSSSWFCWPWYILDYSRFDLPKGVQFE
jgi:hypothetical protein